MSMVEPRVAGPAVILASTWLVSGSAAVPDLVGLSRFWYLGVSWDTNELF